VENIIRKNNAQDGRADISDFKAAIDE
jgi:hypothetical protein